MKYFIIAGEASGDLHGSYLIDSLNNLDPDAEFMCFGGDNMKEKGAIVLKHLNELAFMGITEVANNLGLILKNLKYCKKSIVQYKPDVIILIDYPSFNLKIAKYSKLRGFRTIYYISPKLWAWKEYRIKMIQNFVDIMFVIFPFEVNYYRKFNFPVQFLGNPLLDALEEKLPELATYDDFIAKHKLENKLVIAILPGSRKHEIQRMLPVMLKPVNEYPDFQFIIAGAPAINQLVYDEIIGNNNIPVLFNATYEILKVSVAALVTSGTATLETALIGIPQVVCYKTTQIAYIVGKQLIKLNYISLVNLIMNKQVVKELLQYDFTEENVKNELDKLLFDLEYRSNILKNYEFIRKLLGGPGASQRIANQIYEFLI
ncbi:lipid-A-disaccharide synthase [Bacteroidota bacterium]